MEHRVAKERNKLSCHYRKWEKLHTQEQISISHYLAFSMSMTLASAHSAPCEISLFFFYPLLCVYVTTAVCVHVTG